MNDEEYKKVTKQNNILDFITLTITLEELIKKEKFEIAESIKQILTNNKIEKPEHHNFPDDKLTNYYRIDLFSDTIEEITDLFYELEVYFVGENGESTPIALHYASLADQWVNVNSG